MEFWEQWAAYAYWLDCVPGIGSVTARRLTAFFGSPQAVYGMSDKQLNELCARGFLNQKQAASIREAASIHEAKESDTVEEAYRMILKRGIYCVPLQSPEYPGRLRVLTDPPFNLYVCGSLPEDGRPSVGIVGARLCSDYGKYMAAQFGSKLAAAGIQVVSGMAMGIDGLSQQAALSAGGRSFAVLGCGADICYPRENWQLYRDLKKQGGILSEYVPGTLPRAGLFPMRNRIISGLSDVLLVIEAREKSGTLITVDMALEQGKEIYALPGRVTDDLSTGCNRLIGQGAGIARSPEELAETVWDLWYTKYGVGDLRTNIAAHQSNHRESQKTQEKVLHRPAKDTPCARPGRAAVQTLPPVQRAVYSVLSEEGKTAGQLYQSVCAHTKEPHTFPEISAAAIALCAEELAAVENGRFYRKEGV